MIVSKFNYALFVQGRRVLNVGETGYHKHTMGQCKYTVWGEGGGSELKLPSIESYSGKYNIHYH